MHTVTRKIHFSLDHLWHGDLGVVLKGIHHEAVAADVVYALQDTGGEETDKMEEMLVSSVM